MIALAALAISLQAVHAQGRMDPVERERLRHDLREQAREERHRSRERHPAREGAQGGARRADSMTQRPPPQSSEGRAWPSPRAPHGPGGDDGRRRLTPEERDALRMQLRERRQGRD